MPQCIMGKIHMGPPPPEVTYATMQLMLPFWSPDTKWWVWLDAAAYIVLPNPLWEVTCDHPQTDWQTNTSENITFPVADPGFPIGGVPTS